jgi:hypothetical protein
MYYELDMLKIYVKVKNNEKGLEDDKKMWKGWKMIIQRIT